MSLLRAGSFGIALYLSCRLSLTICYLSRLAPFFFSSRRRHTRCLSDWSSDVCSSDLTPWFSGVRGGAALRRAREPRGRDGRIVAPGGVRAVRDAGVHREDDPQGQPAQIGRASCRERVEITVVDVSLKEKREDRGRRGQ